MIQLFTFQSLSGNFNVALVSPWPAIWPPIAIWNHPFRLTVPDMKFLTDGWNFWRSDVSSERLLKIRRNLPVAECLNIYSAAKKAYIIWVQSGWLCVCCTAKCLVWYRKFSRWFIRLACLFKFNAYFCRANQVPLKRNSSFAFWLLLWMSAQTTWYILCWLFTKYVYRIQLHTIPFCALTV